jgi:hypothetical protein
VGGGGGGGGWKFPLLKLIHFSKLKKKIALELAAKIENVKRLNNYICCRYMHALRTYFLLLWLM